MPFVVNGSGVKERSFHRTSPRFPFSSPPHFPHKALLSSRPPRPLPLQYSFLTLYSSLLYFHRRILTAMPSFAFFPAPRMLSRLPRKVVLMMSGGSPQTRGEFMASPFVPSHISHRLTVLFQGNDFRAYYSSASWRRNVALAFIVGMCVGVMVSVTVFHVHSPLRVDGLPLDRAYLRRHGAGLAPPSGRLRLRARSTPCE